MRFRFIHQGLVHPQNLLLVAGYVFIFVYAFYQFTSMRQLDEPVHTMSQKSLSVETKTYETSAMHVFGEPVNPELKELKNAKWVLKGIIFNNDGMDTAIVEVNQQEKRLIKGDAIDSSTRLYGIEKDKIIVEHLGEKLTKKLYANGQ